MNRKELIDFCNSEVFPLADFDLYGMRETIKLISKWRIGKAATIKMQPEVRNGSLFINGEFLGRVLPKTPQAFPFTEMSYHFEGLCIRDFEEV